MEKSPDAFRTISEVAEHLETPAHVLRFWESRFPQIRPVKRAGGRRYYRPADVALLTGIKRLLHDEGMTIRGVQKILREQGVRFVSGMADENSAEDDDAALEAALASSSGPSDPAPVLPPAEAEAAQVIALQTALTASSDGATPETESKPDEGKEEPDDGTAVPDDEEQKEDEDAGPLILPTPFSPKARESEQSSPTPRKVPVDDGIPDLFSRMVASTAASEDDVAGEAAVDDDVEIIDFNATPGQSRSAEINAGQHDNGDVSITDDAANDDQSNQDEPAAEEAPMAIWAEEPSGHEEKGDPEVAGSPEPGPVLRITRIGASSTTKTSPPAAAPIDQSDDVKDEKPIASRLRATRVHQLSNSERGTITVVRARARSLRDRLLAPPRLGQ